ncbi:MAG TPA: DNRLRE domain-containing protein [Candidatus Polarisedimenticolaceae bacterium]|nr:DNRLRE domain-containing protein [Candidatus Polarisedimenticolaceae bacterium]
MLILALALTTITLTADRDATLVEQPDGTLANGSGPVLFAGRNNLSTDGVRRALIRFDLSGLAPRENPLVASSAAVVLANTTESNVEPREYRLHRVLADWSEGPSASSGGGGAPSVTGDATWIHASYPHVFWMHSGGQFEGTPSARLEVAGPGVYRFDGEGLLRDLQLWYRHPELNFGWVLIGDETTRQNSRAFGSRENSDPALRPALELTYPRRETP